MKIDYPVYMKSVKVGYRISAINRLTGMREYISSVGDWSSTEKKMVRFCKTPSKKRPFIYPRINAVIIKKK